MHNYFRLIVYFIFYFWLINFHPVNCLGQKDDIKYSARYGMYAAYNMNSHNADFRALPGFPNCCPRFSSGNGGGFNFGILYDYPLLEKFTLEARLGYSSISGILTNDELKTILDDSTVQSGLIRHHLETKFSLITLNPQIRYEVIPSLYLHAGFDLGALINSTFTQNEELVEPTGKTFENGSRIRNSYSDNIPKTNSIFYSADFGVAYELPLNMDENITASLESFYKLYLNPVVKDLTWSINSLSIGVSLRYTPIKSNQYIRFEFKENKKIDTVNVITELQNHERFKTGKEIYKFDTLVGKEEITFFTDTKRTDTLFTYKAKNLEASISAYGVDPDGTEKEIITIKTEQFLTTLMTPLLNYIFFEEGSAELQTKYKQNPLNIYTYNIDSVNSINKLQTYYDVLNIIGKRMLDNPKANIRLIGCNTNLSIEKDNKKLSEARVLIIKQFFTQTWKIDPNRISVEFRNLPDNPSTSSNKDGVEENRRVEIHSDSYEILKPIITNDTLVQVTPVTIRFKPIVAAEAGIRNWEINSKLSNATLKTFSGTSSINSNYDWEVNKEYGSMPKLDSVIYYSLTVNDLDGNNKTITHPIKTESISIQKKRRELLNDKEIERYSLILFEVNSYDIKDVNSKIIEIIKPRIKSNSIVRITGHTDRLGLSESNRILSVNRANSTSTALGMEKKAETEGLGDRVKLFNNDIPEGRFYCRTVDVIIETPIN